jgi:hypothetical protein
LDYLVFNISGYTFYTIYSTAGYFTDIKGAGTVVIADLIFVYHSVAMVAIQTIQCFIYEVCVGGFREERTRYPGLLLSFCLLYGQLLLFKPS